MDVQSPVGCSRAIALLAAVAVGAGCSKRSPPHRGALPPVASAPSAPAEGAALGGSALALFPVLEGGGAVNSFDVAPMRDGAVVSMGPFVAVVHGDTVRQDPAWMAGLPEFINWDSDVHVTTPPASTGPGMPTGTVILVRAGNRHGPGGFQVWDGARWPAEQTRPPEDARVQALKREDTDEPVVAWVDATRVFAARGFRDARGGDGRATEVFYFDGRAKPRVLVVPHESADPAADPTVELAAIAPGQAWMCRFGERTAVRLREGSFARLPLPPGETRSCAATSDGALLWVHDDGGRRRLLRHTPAGRWEALEPPEGVAPTRVHAAGERFWVRGERGAGWVLLSNAPVKRTIDLSWGRQFPHDFVAGITGLEASSYDVPSVSEAPPGPGTPACSSLVLYLGPTMTPALRAALARHPETQGRRVMHVEGFAPGRVAPDPRYAGAQLRLLPSGRPRAAVALSPLSHADGLRMLDALEKDVPESRLVCAAPRVLRTEGP